MRSIKKIIIHCSDTPEGRAVTIRDIDRWHRQKGWSGIGYHFVIYLDGSVHAGRPLDKSGAHCYGHNRHSIGICYIGGRGANGRAKDTRTPEQREALRRLVAELRQQYPSATIHGHNEFARKACPSFIVARDKDLCP